MITITTEGKTLTVHLETGIGFTYFIKSERDCPMDAALLRSQLNKYFGDQMEAIRRESYEKGWSDKTKRKQKQTWFSNRFNHQ